VCVMTQQGRELCASCMHVACNDDKRGPWRGSRGMEGVSARGDAMQGMAHIAPQKEYRTSN
jgi:hypothetical protein